MDRTLVWAAVLLVGVFLLFESTALDVWMQDFCYNFSTHTWRVDELAEGPRLLFYTGPKMGIIALGVALLVLAVGPARWRAVASAYAPAFSRVNLWVVIATLASAPALVALSKATTNVFCPREILRYGGDVPYVRMLEICSPEGRPRQRGRCFPAGHASGGFALVSLAGLAHSRRGQALGVLAGLALGSMMGGYQMLKGAHYLSHTVVTALVCWIIFLVWRRLLGATATAPSPAWA